MKLVTSEQMRELERRAEAAGVTVAELMENAGLAVAQETWLTLGDVFERPVLVLVGPGNNGGDGLVAARHLFDWGAKVTVYMLRPRSEEDSNYRQIVELGVPTEVATNDPGFQKLEALLDEAHAVIDALLGTGASRPIEGDLAAILERLQAARGRPRPLRLVAVDLPTGLDPDTGRVDPHCVAPDETVALGYGKVGLYLMPGSQHAGRIQVVDIGIPATVSADVPLDLLTADWVRSRLPARPPDANKGTFGRVMVVAGSVNYVGAAALAASAAMRVGAGLVTLACPQSIYASATAKLTESTFIPLPDSDGRITEDAARVVLDALSGYDALVIGCGLGQSAAVQGFLRALLAGLPAETLRGVVLDADGLNNLVHEPEWWRLTPVPTVITPHPGEMARLAGTTVADVQGGRVDAARRYAVQWDKILLLKGANTVIAASDGQTLISPFANAVLATAGTGDVLAGAIGGLIAQGLAPFVAAGCAVYLHGTAGDKLRKQMGSAGALAGDLLALLPVCQGELRREIELEPLGRSRPSFLDMLGQMPQGMGGMLEEQT